MQWVMGILNGSFELNDSDLKKKLLRISNIENKV